MKYLTLHKKTFLIIGFFLVLFLVYLTVSNIKRSKNTIKEENYLEAIALINEKLPITLDDETQLRSVELKDNAIQYTYFLFNKQKQEIEATRLENSFRKEVLKSYCSNTDAMKQFRKSGYIAHYVYLDTNLEEVFSTSLTPKDCK